jgi:glucose-6-phosphate isomerase
MKPIEIQIEKASTFVGTGKLSEQFEKAAGCLLQLKNKTGPGNDFLGWLDLPKSISPREINEIKGIAESFQKFDALVIVGIGGSYLGAKAVIDSLSNSFQFLSGKGKPIIFYAGQNLSEDYLAELTEVLDKFSYGIVVISKSGTTTEPALAFRILKNHLIKKVGKTEAAERIVTITDKEKGALKKLADEEGYKTLVIPNDIGGRYSVLTSVGLLPIAIAGFPIDELIDGASKMAQLCLSDISAENPAIRYAAIRNALYQAGRNVEIMVNYHPKMVTFAEWWKQLYGESEGKEGKGIFPSSVLFTTDLHSMGQYIQDGERILFETILSIKNPEKTLAIPEETDDADELNYLAGKGLEEVNKMAELGTMIAHADGNVPNIRIEIPSLNPYYIGQLIYFFEVACAISGYMLGVNPFDQPGVEAYKKNMFALLKKPGFENETEAIYRRLK